MSISFFEFILLFSCLFYIKKFGWISPPVLCSFISAGSAHRFSASHRISFFSVRSSSPLHRNRPPNTTEDSRVCFYRRIPSYAAYWQNRRCPPFSALRISTIFGDMRFSPSSGCGSCRIRESFCPARCIFLSAARRWIEGRRIQRWRNSSACSSRRLLSSCKRGSPNTAHVP